MSREVVGRIPATPIQATILNLSLSGCLAKAQSPLIQKGRTILLDLSETDEIAGTVVWRQGDRLGVKFVEEISQETLSRLAAPDVEQPREDATLRDRFGRRLPPLAARVRIT